MPAHEVIDLGPPSQDEKTPKASVEPEPPQNIDFLEIIARAYAVSPTELYQKDMAVFLEWLRSHCRMAEPKETPSAQAASIWPLKGRNKHIADPAYDVCHAVSGDVKYNISRTHVTHAGKGKLTAEQAFEMALLASLNPVMQTSPLKLTGSAEDQALLKAACDKLNLRATCSVNVSPETQADATHFISKVYDKLNEANSPSNQDHLFNTIALKPIIDFKKQLSELTAGLEKLSHDSGQISAQFAKWGENLGGDEQLSQQISDQTRTDILAYKEALDRLSQLQAEFDQRLETLKSDSTIDQRYKDELQQLLEKTAGDLVSSNNYLNDDKNGAVTQFNMLNGDDKKIEFPAKVETPPDQGTDSKTPDLTAQFNQVSLGLSSQPGYERDIEGVHPEMKNALRAAYIIASGSHDKSLARIDFLISVLLSMESKFEIKLPPQLDSISNILKHTGHIEKDATRDGVLSRLAAPSSQPA